MSYGFTPSAKGSSAPAGERGPTHTDSRDDLWVKFGTLIQDQDMQRVRRWEEEMDNLLVFAGLSSAVMTAFVIESWPLLQPSSADATVLLLERISQQLDSFSVSTRFINSTQPSLTVTAIQPPIPASALRINILWFASLTLCLASALGSILVKQWLGEYRRMLHLPPSLLNLQLRQTQYEALKQWSVPAFTTVLPTLLQVAIALFWAGLVDLLWTLDNTLAIVLSVIISVCFGGILATFILPAIFSDCAYKSPAAWAFVKLVLIGKGALNWAWGFLHSSVVALGIDRDPKLVHFISRLLVPIKGLLLVLHPFITRKDAWNSHLAAHNLKGKASSIISSGLVSSVASSLGSHDLERILGILEPATRVEVLFSILAGQLGFANPVDFRRSLRSNSVTALDGDWFLGLRKFSIGSSAEMTLLLDVASFAQCYEGDTSTTSILDILLLFQQLAKDLLIRSRSFDQKYIEFLVGTPWELDSVEPFSDMVQSIAVRSLCDMFEHYVKPALPAISIERVLQLLPPLLARIKKSYHKKSHSEDFQNVYTLALEFIRHICIRPLPKEYSGETLRHAIQDVVGLILEIGTGNLGPEFIAFPTATKLQWFAAITRLAKTNCDLMPDNFGQALWNSCALLRLHHEAGAIKELLRVCQYPIKEDHLLECIAQLTAWLHRPGGNSLVYKFDHQQDLLRKDLEAIAAPTYAYIKSLKQPVNHLISLLHTSRWLCRDDPDVLSAFDILYNLFVHLPLDCRQHLPVKDYLCLLAESVYKGHTEHIEHKATVSLGAILQLWPSSITRINMVPIYQYTIRCYKDDMNDSVQRSRIETLTTLALHAFTYQSTNLMRRNTNATGLCLQRLMQLHTELIKLQTRQQIKFLSNADFLLVLARRRKTLVPESLVHALYRAHLRGLLLDSGPSCLRLSLKLSAKFSLAERYLPATELLWLEYSAELCYMPMFPAIQLSEVEANLANTSSELLVTDKTLASSTPTGSPHSSTDCPAIICIQTILLQLHQDPQNPQPELLIQQAQHLFSSIPSMPETLAHRWFTALRKLKDLNNAPLQRPLLDWLYNELQINDEDILDGTLSANAEEIVGMYRTVQSAPLAHWIRGQMTIIRKCGVDHPLNHLLYLAKPISGQDHRSWGLWVPDPDYVPTPPSREPIMLVPSPQLWPGTDSSDGFQTDFEWSDPDDEHAPSPMEEGNPEDLPDVLRHATQATGAPAQDIEQSPDAAWQAVPSQVKKREVPSIESDFASAEPGRPHSNSSPPDSSDRDDVEQPARETSANGEGLNNVDQGDLLQGLKSLPEVHMEAAPQQAIFSVEGWQAGE